MARVSGVIQVKQLKLQRDGDRVQLLVPDGTSWQAFEIADPVRFFSAGLKLAQRAEVAKRELAEAAADTRRRR